MKVGMAMMVAMVTVGMVMAGEERLTCEASSPLFDPADSESFSLIQQLDESYIGEDLVKIGELRVRTRFSVLSCPYVASGVSAMASDGILGLGWSAEHGSPAILKTLASTSRPSWNLTQEDFEPMPPVFSITVIDDVGQIMLGGYDPEVVDGTLVSHNLSLSNGSYAVEVTGMMLGGVDLLNFSASTNSTLARIDINSLCILIPNSTMDDLLAENPYEKLLRLYESGNRSALLISIEDEVYEVPYSACIEPSDEGIVLGASWLRSYLMSFNFSNALNLSVAVGRKNDSFALTSDTGEGYAIQVSPGDEQEGEGKEGGAGFSSISFLLPVEFGSPPARKKLMVSIDTPVTSIVG